MNITPTKSELNFLEKEIKNLPYNYNVFKPGFDRMSSMTIIVEYFGYI